MTQAVAQDLNRPHLRPRRTLNRIALALLALTIGAVAQASLRQEGVWDGIILFAVAAVLFVRAVGPATLPPTHNLTPYRGLFASLNVRRGWLTWVSLWLMVGAAIISFLGQQLFAQGSSLITAWWHYALSLLLLLLGALLLTRPKRPGRSSHQHRWEFRFVLTPHTVILLAIMAIALFLRMWQFDELPFGVWFDEAQAGLEARRWLDEPDYKPAFFDPINVSGQFLILYAGALRYISDSVHGLRLISVLFGLGGVWLAYLFGKTIRGPEFGLVMAFFMAVMRWHVNFSRIAMTGIDTPFFELLSLYFLARLMRHGYLRDAIFAGMALGFGLTFYTAFRLFVLALGLFILLAVFIWRQWWGRAASASWWSNQLLRAVLLILAAVIVLMPILQYARNHPESFSSRVQTTSIFNRREDPNLQRALRTSLQKHIGMLHYKGDKNGRHNLPGEPMLDPAMGILFVLGLGVATRRLFSRQPHPADLFFLLLVPASLVGGVFSLDFEAPQSLRSIGLLPALAYFCTVPVISLFQEVKRVFAGYSPNLFWWPAGLAALYILGFNGYTYFSRQADDFAVWNAYSTAETVSARRMVELGPNYDHYLSPFLSNHPTVRFITRDQIPRQTLTLPDPLPIRAGAIRPVAIYIHPDEHWVFAEAQQLYPLGRFEEISNKPEHAPSLFLAEIPVEAQAAIQGLRLNYWAGSEKQPNQIPVKSLIVDTIDVDWATSVPLTPPYVAEWQGILYIPLYGTYEFSLDAPGEAILEIDGIEMIRGEGQQTTYWDLAKGNHALKLTAQSGEGVVQLRWRPPVGAQTLIPNYALYHGPVTNNGLLGKYYGNGDWAGEPAFAQIDPFLDAYFHLTPLPRPYSVEWSGMLEVPETGIYNLGLRVVGNAQLWVDGLPLVETQLPNQIRAGASSLTAGLHEIKILFQDIESRSRIHLMWQPPNQADMTTIPPDRLWPSLGSVQQANLQLAEPVTDFEPAVVTLSHLATLREGLREPRDIAVNVDGLVFIADTGQGAVQVFEDGALIDSWDETPDGPLQEPLALVADSFDQIWVLDSTRQWIYAFDSDGQYLQKIGGPEAQFYHPRGLTISRQPDVADTLIVANTGFGNLRLFDLSGIPLGSIGFSGDAPGQFNEPVDVLRDEFGAYFVTEGANIQRWQRVDPFGKPLNTWPMDTPVAFNGSHMTWGPDGSIFMTHSGLGRLLRFSPNGILLEEWHTIDEVTLNQPVGIYFDENADQLYVADVGSGVVHVFQVDWLELVE